MTWMTRRVRTLGAKSGPMTFANSYFCSSKNNFCTLWQQTTFRESWSIKSEQQTAVIHHNSTDFNRFWCMWTITWPYKFARIHTTSKVYLHSPLISFIHRHEFEMFIQFCLIVYLPCGANFTFGFLFYFLFFPLYLTHRCCWCFCCGIVEPWAPLADMNISFCIILNGTWDTKEVPHDITWLNI